MLGPFFWVTKPASFEIGCSFCSWVFFFALCLLSACVSALSSLDALAVVSTTFSVCLRCLLFKNDFLFNALCVTDTY